MRRVLVAAALWLLSGGQALAAQYPVTGMVTAVDAARRAFTASIGEIPGVMPAMTMAFDVREQKDLEGLTPGAVVEFTLVVDKKASHAERIRVVRYRSVQADPLAAVRLGQLSRIVGGPAATKPLAVGDLVPDFRLTDQRRQTVSLGDLRGKVVAINFIYTRCALPDFCLRIANNFGVLQRRFQKRLGRDLVLLTVTFDPLHDTPEALAGYARQFNAVPESWRFLTGPVADVQRVCALFGVAAFADEGLMNHNLHTALIDRSGKLLANIEGNAFTATQLGDLTETALKEAPIDRPPEHGFREQ